MVGAIVALLACYSSAHDEAWQNFQTETFLIGKPSISMGNHHAINR
jgi:hypothetical protein